MNKFLVVLGLTLFIVGVCLVIPSSAFVDNFQYQNDAAEFGEKWSKYGTAGGGYCVVIGQGLNYEPQSNFPSGYTYSKAFHLATCGNAFYSGYVWIKSTKFSGTTNYVSLNVLSFGSGYGSGADAPQLYIKLFNDADVEIASFNVLSYTQGTGLWEVVRRPDTNNLYFFLNGVNVVGGGGAVDTCAEPFSYIQFYLNTPSNAPSGYSYADMYIDDISTTGYVDGIGSYQYTHKLTEDDPTEIDYSWTMKHYPNSTFDDHEYKVQIRNSDGDIISSETLTGADRDSGIRKYNSTTLFSLNYDWYYFFITRDGVEYDSEYLEYLHPYSPGCNIVFDDDIYYKGEVAKISYTNYDPDYETNDYYVRVYYISGEKTLIETWEITSGTSGYVEWDSTGVDEGFYLAELRVIIPGEDENGPLAYDMSAVASGILISGITYDPVSCTALGSVNVNFSQSNVWYNTTSNTTSGYYELKGFNTNEVININASKTSYTHNDFTFTPPVEIFYEMDLYLIPNTESSDSYGLVLGYPLYQGINASTVTLQNASWSDTNITNACGFYEFNDVTAGAYNVSGVAGGYVGSGNESVTLPTRHDLLLHPSITLKVYAKVVATGDFLSDFQVSVDAGALQSAVGGFVTFSEMDWGYYQLRCVADGYYVNYKNVFLVEDKSVTIDMTAMPTAGGMGVQYVAKHEVQFVVQDKYGNPIDDVTVTVTVTESSGPSNWYNIIFGYSNETQLENTTLQGSTDSMGAISFHMAETLKYKIVFKNLAKDVDETLYIYPKEEYYLIRTGKWFDWFGWFSGDDEPDIGGKINWNFTTYEIDDDNAWINITYNATLCAGTNDVYFWINASNNTLNIHNETWNANDFCTYNHTITSYSGNAYYVGFEANHSTKGTIRVVKIAYFKEDRMVSIDGWKDGYYHWLSIVLLFFGAALFSGVTIKTGALVLPFGALGLWYVGWFNCSLMLILVVMTIGTLYFITSKGRETRLGG